MVHIPDPDAVARLLHAQNAINTGTTGGIAHGQAVINNSHPASKPATTSQPKKVHVVDVDAVHKLHATQDVINTGAAATHEEAQAILDAPPTGGGMGADTSAGGSTPTGPVSPEPSNGPHIVDSDAVHRLHATQDVINTGVADSHEEARVILAQQGGGKGGADISGGMGASDPLPSSTQPSEGGAHVVDVNAVGTLHATQDLINRGVASSHEEALAILSQPGGKGGAGTTGGMGAAVETPAAPASVVAPVGSAETVNPVDPNAAAETLRLNEIINTGAADNYDEAREILAGQSGGRGDAGGRGAAGVLFDPADDLSGVAPAVNSSDAQAVDVDAVRRLHATQDVINTGAAATHEEAQAILDAPPTGGGMGADTSAGGSTPTGPVSPEPSNGPHIVDSDAVNRLHETQDVLNAGIAVDSHEDARDFLDGSREMGGPDGVNASALGAGLGPTLDGIETAGFMPTPEIAASLKRMKNGLASPDVILESIAMDTSMSPDERVVAAAAVINSAENNQLLSTAQAENMRSSYGYLAHGNVDTASYGVDMSPPTSDTVFNESAIISPEDSRAGLNQAEPSLTSLTASGSLSVDVNDGQGMIQTIKELYGGRISDEKALSVVRKLSGSSDKYQGTYLMDDGLLGHSTSGNFEITDDMLADIESAAGMQVPGVADETIDATGRSPAASGLFSSGGGTGTSVDHQADIDRIGA
ncbi:MAG: hypothetical protein AAF413_02745 [Patescibacteria group bacterium]